MDQSQENTSLAEKNSAALEALLFIYGEPLTIKRIGGILKLPENETKEAIDVLDSRLRREDRGLFIIRDEDKIQLSTKPEFGKLLEDITKEEFKESLTTASLETLSIISYAAPITRAEIDFIRGVNSTFILRSLLIRGLIDRIPDPKRSNAYLYKPSFELLKHLGISKAGDLPDYQRFVDLIKNLRTAPSLGEPSAEILTQQTGEVSAGSAGQTEIAPIVETKPEPMNNL